MVSLCPVMVHRVFLSSESKLQIRIQRNFAIICLVLANLNRFLLCCFVAGRILVRNAGPVVRDRWFGTSARPDQHQTRPAKIFHPRISARINQQKFCCIYKTGQDHQIPRPFKIALSSELIILIGLTAELKFEITHRPTLDNN